MASRKSRDLSDHDLSESFVMKHETSIWCISKCLTENISFNGISLMQAFPLQSI